MAKVVDRRLYGKPREKYWISYIRQRIRENKNFLGFISGPTGSGKSYTSLRIGMELNEDFSPERIVFSGLELMSLINSGKLKKGSVIIFEEIGVNLDAKNWQSTTNKMLNYLMQTFRHRNFIFIMNSPYMDFVDASTRKLFHAEMSTAGIDSNKKQVRLKPHQIQYNPRIKKFYYKRLKVITAQGKVPVDWWLVDMPSKDLIKAYEEKKKAFTDKLNKDIQAELQAIEDKKHKGQKKELTDNQEEILGMIKEGLSVKQIATLKDRNERAIYKTMEFIKKKGYELKPVYDEITHKKVLKYDIVEPERK
jgi:DNA-binding CsgD family transcriptional regulator